MIKFTYQKTMIRLRFISFKIGVLISFIVGLSACNTSKYELLPLPFVEVISEASGLNFSNDLNDTGDLNIIEYLYYYNGGGVAVGDINNDGLDDVYLSANQKPDKLFLNQGDLKFKDVSEESGISNKSAWSTGVTMVDVNNDGLLDIYVCKVGNYKNLKSKNELYINQGGNVFIEDAKTYGIDFSGFSTQASFFDYDNDGDMDMYLMNHSIHSTASYGNANLRTKRDALAGDQFFENRLNEGKTSFVNVTEKVGIYSSALGYGLAIAVSDINQDGYMDVFVGNDFHENDYLYINNGNKTFTESSTLYFNHTSRFTMGVDIADVTNNGLQDIFTLDMMPYKSDIFLKSGGEDTDKVNNIKKAFGFQQQYARNHMQIHNKHYFVDVALFTETHATDWSWAPLLMDYDNDGLNDIYITNGIYKRPNDLDYINFSSNIDFAKHKEETQNALELELINKMPMIKLPNAIFRNNGNLNFENVLIKAEATYSNGAAYSDLDNDGDLDIIVNNINDQATLLENKSTNNYVSINLKGDKNSLNTNGTKVYLFSEGKPFFKEQTTVKGFMSSSTAKIHFGLGNIQKVDSVKVVWLDGSQSIRRNIPINTTLDISKENTTPFSYKLQLTTSFVETFNYEHIEDRYLDYEREALMPEKLSIEGPSVVHEDFNGDGLKDLFVGGARNQKPELYIQAKNGELSKKRVEAFEEDASYEDTDAIAFDIDGDGDKDIYALSGGNDFIENHSKLEDRIYINDGKANFTKLNANLIKTNGSTVSNFDFDKDGLEDLFIGNRSIPGAYGLSPYSFILKNKGNKTFEIVDKKRFGMVTDSKWADIDKDGFVELILVGDWMPITILSYIKSGEFENKTQQFGLNKTNGMWNVLEISDINNDGTLDIVAGNTGLNFKWKASVDKPVKMYLDDFDNNGNLDQLIFYDFFGDYVPFASKDKIVAQIPSLKKKFLSYNTFSKVESIADLTDKKSIDVLETKHIYQLKSMLYLNSGSKFLPVELPKEAQLSSIEDMLVLEDKILFTGNYKGYVTELGESSSNSGGILNMNDDKTFSYQSLNLPKTVSGRKIIKLRDETYLVITNNGKSFFVKTSKTE